MSEISDKRSAIEEILLLQKHYIASIACWNCFAVNRHQIPKGTPKSAVVIDCHNCGCSINMGKGKP